MKTDSLVFYSLVAAALMFLSPLVRAVAVVVVAKFLTKELAKLAIPLILQPRRAMPVHKATALGENEGTSK
jgi:hypothetical protein